MSSTGHESSGGADEEAPSGLQRVVWFRQMLHRWQSSSSSRSSDTARRSSASGDDGDDGAGADDDDATTGRKPNDDATTGRKPNDDATPAAAADNNASSSSRTASQNCAAGDDEDRRRLLPRVVVVEERRRDYAAAACESPMTPDLAPAPADVPRGCCPVYVGAERRRFVVPTAYLGMPVFRRLLEKAEEEFEFDYRGGALTIPCDTEAFKYILVVMERHRQGLVDDDGNDRHEEHGGVSSSQAR